MGGGRRGQGGGQGQGGGTTVRESARGAERRGKRTGDAITRGVMQPVERRGSQLAVEGDREVTSSSIGEEPERRVVVSLRKPAAE